MTLPSPAGARFRRLTLAAVLLACAGAAFGQTPAAPPRLDVSTSPGSQLLSGVALDGLGNVTLLGTQLLGRVESARRRRFSATDVSLGRDFVLAPVSASGGVAANVRGDTVLSWNQPRSGGGTDVVVRRTSPLFPTADLVANGPGALSRGPGDVAIDRNGNFVAVWDVSTPSGFRVFGQRFNANGTRQGPELDVVTATDGNHGSARVAMDPATGELVVVWVAANTDGTIRGIFGQRFGFLTGRQGSEFKINTTEGRVTNPDVGRAEDGSFVAVWKHPVADFASDIFGQRFDAAGARVGGEIVIADRSPITDGYPRMSMDLASNWVVAWDDGGPPLFVRLYRRDDTPAGPARELVNGTTPFPGAPQLAFGFNGTFVLGWTDFIGIHEPEDDTWEVNFQRFSASPGLEACLFQAGHFRCDTDDKGVPLEVDHPFGGGAGSVPHLADVDGDGRADPCVRRNARLLCDTAHNGGAAETQFAIDPSGGLVLGDVDGDGRADPCVLKPGHFLCDTAHNSGAPEVDIAFGAEIFSDRGSEGIAMLGDVDGDGRDDPCVAMTHTDEYRCDTAHDGGAPEIVFHFGAFGGGGYPLLADWDGDGRDDPCYYIAGHLTCDTAHDGGAPEFTFFLGKVPLGAPLLLGNIDGM